MSRSNEETEAAQDLLMEGVCNRDQEAGILQIDEALARGANFSAERVEPLKYAVFCKLPRTLAHLIARGATIAAEWPNNQFEEEPSDWCGQTALHYAAEQQDCECLRLLLGADGVRFLEKYDEVSRTPLIVAAEKGNLRAAEILLDAGADINANDESHIGDTAIKRAVEELQPAMVRLLLDRGADPTIPGWMQLTAIHRAQLGGEETREMLEMIRAHLRVSDEEWSRLLISTQG